VAVTPTATVTASGDYAVISGLKSKSVQKNADEFSPDWAKNKGDLEAKLAASRSEVRELQKQLERAQRRQMELEMETAKWRAERAAYPAGKGSGGMAANPFVPGAMPKKPEENRTSSTSTRLGDKLKLSSGYNRDARDAARREKRLDQLEQNLQALLDEVRELKHEHPDANDPDRVPSRR
jgi:chromosome segregation ATPase